MQRAPGASVVVVAILVAPVSAQLQWTPVGLNARSHHAMATDLARQRVVLSGVVNGDTFEWDGSRWSARRPLHKPPPLWWLATGGGTYPSASMAYDFGRRRTVLFECGSPPGAAAPPIAGTWEWDGTDWEQRAVPQGPPARTGHRLAYDLVRGRTVLFGGFDALNTPLSDTWEWDGTTWIPMLPASSPSARGFHGLAFDARSGRVLLFGGTTSVFPNGQALADTWAWDGTNWTRLAPVNSPPARCVTMAGDLARGRVVLHGGGLFSEGPGTFTDTWEWDGANWNAIASANAPPPRVGHDMALDSTGRMLLSGGQTSFGGWLGDLWAWDGTNWSELRRPAPSGRSDHALAYDPVRDRVVLFGGDDGAQKADTWLWDGDGWLDVSPAVSPPARSAHVMTFDPLRQRVVLFGGTGRNDTWEWDGTSWLQRFPASPPPSQVKPAMAWDDARQRVFMYGSGNFEWDGTQWTQRPSIARPSSTQNHTMTFDPRRGRVLLFGGQVWAQEMWEWDGVNWTQIVLGSPAPAARRDGTMMFDAVLGRVLLWGGSRLGFAGDVWEWDGSAWADRLPWLFYACNPYARYAHAMVHDARRGRNVMFGGLGGGYFQDETWELAPINPASYAPYGAGCAGSAGVPALAAAGWQLPWLGETFTAHVRPVPAVTAGLMFTGYSRTSWLGIPLPLSLTGIGMPGCSLLASGQIALALSVSSGVGTLALPLPMDAALLGAPFYQQALIVDLPANPAGLVVSNGAAGRFGQR